MAELSTLQLYRAPEFMDIQVDGKVTRFNVRKTDYDSEGEPVGFRYSAIGDPRSVLLVND